MSVQDVCLKEGLTHINGCTHAGTPRYILSAFRRVDRDLGPAKAQSARGSAPDSRRSTRPSPVELGLGRTDLDLHRLVGFDPALVHRHPSDAAPSHPSRTSSLRSRSSSTAGAIGLNHSCGPGPPNPHQSQAPSKRLQPRGTSHFGRASLAHVPAHHAWCPLQRAGAKKTSFEVVLAPPVMRLRITERAV